MISTQAEKTYIMLRNLNEQNRSKHYMNPNMNMNMNMNRKQESDAHERTARRVRTE